MNKQLKEDWPEFINYIDRMTEFEWLGKTRNWWPQFIFHFTNIDNAIKVLESGKLLCRFKLEKNKQMVTDNASSDVLSNTDEKWKKYVRLYFRPRTPTQNVNEGYRPSSFRELNAHCPVPIYFLFSSKKLLSRKDVYFSKKSLANHGSEIFSDFNSFKEIPFDLVYHDSWFNPDERDTIVQHRHAEVVVPEELDLQELRFIWCRSEAEYTTLLHLLSDSTRDRWKNCIGGGKKGNLFFRNWFFVEKCICLRDSIIFKFNPPSIQCTETVHLRVDIKEMGTQTVYWWEDEEFSISQNELNLDLSKIRSLTHYEIRLYVDGQLMCFDRFEDDEFALPF